ncbi:hypothetical protein E5288_WYG005151 [Bos mutus]|uniref:Uncharacterized protein n=1 Tax=Bos mutus TaxID=72004 RepID=A0A6B0S2X1_9CETA|nr:hypothetical protein [Bos mutus]
MQVLLAPHLRRQRRLWCHLQASDPRGGRTVSSHLRVETPGSEGLPGRADWAPGVACFHSPAPAFKAEKVTQQLPPLLPPPTTATPSGVTSVALHRASRSADKTPPPALPPGTEGGGHGLRSPGDE